MATDERKQGAMRAYFDGVDDAFIARGWAVDTARAQRRVAVRIIDESGAVLAQGIADRYREDLERNGIGDGRHAFEIPLPEELKARRRIVLSVVPEEGEFVNAATEEVRAVYEADPLAGLTQIQRKMYQGFDAEWVRKRYGFEGEDTELFRTYLSLVGETQISPNSHFNEKLYLAKYPDVLDAVKRGVFSCAYEHYLVTGREEGRTSEISPAPLTENLSPAEASLRYMQAFFDEAWYLRNYPDVREEMDRREIATPFDHYLKVGISQRYSPNDRFDEEWYVAFYADVADAVEEGRYLCGFEHYLLRGKAEHRSPKRHSFSIVNYKFGEAVRPAGLEQQKALEQKYLDKPAVVRIRREQPRIVFIVPTMDRDIMFGGYIGLVEFARRFLEHGLDLKMIITEDPHMSEAYFWYNFSRLIPDAERYKERVEYQNFSRETTFEIAQNDRFFAYSAWTALIASKLVGYTDEEKFIYLRQEDERIFHSHGSQSAIIDAIYRLPQVAIFNTKELLDYFKTKKIGFFGREEERRSRVFYFDPVICSIEPFDPEKSAASPSRNFVFYARPEAHASRNLFEIGIMALKQAIQRGVFDENWNFHGIGAAKDYTVELAEGKVLQIQSKVSLDEYKRMLKEYDVGMFLMYAPHPGLLGLEMTSAGLVTIVNTFDYRDAEYFRKISGNFVVADPDPESLTKAMEEAIIKSSDLVQRVANAYVPKYRCWNEVFDDQYIADVLEAVNLGIERDESIERKNDIYG